jgi:hypothetical protein
MTLVSAAPPSDELWAFEEPPPPQATKVKAPQATKVKDKNAPSRQASECRVFMEFFTARGRIPPAELTASATGTNVFALGAMGTSGT